MCDGPRDELLSASTGKARGEGLGKNTPGLLGRGFSGEPLGGYGCPRIFNKNLVLSNELIKVELPP